MKRSTFLTSIFALILAPFGVKALRKEPIYNLNPSLDDPSMFVGKIRPKPTEYINESSVMIFDANHIETMTIHDGNVTYWRSLDGGNLWGKLNEFPSKGTRA